MHLTDTYYPPLLKNLKDTLGTLARSGVARCEGRCKSVISNQFKTLNDFPTSSDLGLLRPDLGVSIGSNTKYWAYNSDILGCRPNLEHRYRCCYMHVGIVIHYMLYLPILITTFPPH